MIKIDDGFCEDNCGDIINMIQKGSYNFEIT